METRTADMQLVKVSVSTPLTKHNSKQQEATSFEDKWKMHVLNVRSQCAPLEQV